MEFNNTSAYVPLSSLVEGMTSLSRSEENERYLQEIATFRTKGLTDAEILLYYQDKNGNIQSRNIEQTVFQEKLQAIENKIENVTEKREQWGSEATLLKIINEIKNSSSPLTFSRLLECGPQQTCNPRMVATACFTSLLKLKQANIIKVLKEDNSTDIKFIKLGAVLNEEEFL